MKDSWTPQEVARMPWSPLAFTHADVALIRNGLALRAARLSGPVTGRPATQPR